MYLRILLSNPPRCHTKVTETIEKIQNKAIRIIAFASKKFSVTSGRSLLNLPTVGDKIYFTILHIKK